MIPRICLFAILCVLLSALLDGMGFKSKGLFSLLCALLMLLSLADSLGELYGGILSLVKKAGITDSAACALKAVGLGYVFGFTADVCASLGEGLIATVVTAVGRVQIFLLAYPYFEKIVKLGVELLQ